MAAQCLQRPVVVGPTECELEPGLIGGEARLERERRKDDLGRYAVLGLLPKPLIRIGPTDDRHIELALGHELARLEAFDEQGAPAIVVTNVRRAICWVWVMSWSPWSGAMPGRQV